RQEARAAYQRWGATAKVQEIAPEVSVERAAIAEVRAESLDALSFVKASQAISTEIVLAKLIQSLMRIVIEQAGAERGYLILLHDGELWVEGLAGTVEPTGFERFRLEADDGDAGAGRFSLPRSIIGYAQRTKEKVLISDTDGQNLFAADAHLRDHRPRSLLCLPMIRQGDLVGLLYLENSLTGGAFTPDRVELLDVLSSHAAVSLDN